MCAPADAVCIEAHKEFNSICFLHITHAELLMMPASPVSANCPNPILDFVYFSIVACVALIEFRIFTPFAGRPAELHAGPGFCIRN
jgi:hypothetical protein